MKTPKTFSRVFGVAALAVILFATAAILRNGTGRVSAFNPQPDPPAFGLISLNPGQSLRINVLNRAVPAGASVSGHMRHTLLGFGLYIDVPPGPCVAAHRFANRQSCEVTVAPGEGASFDLTVPTEIVLSHVLPEVQDDDRNNRDLIYTVEVRENGKTIYLVPAVQRATPADSSKQ